MLYVSAVIDTISNQSEIYVHYNSVIFDIEVYSK